MARCASCGSELKEGSRFCSECGAPVPMKRTCPSCGMEVPDGSRFCMYCGTRLDAAEVPPAASGISVGSRNVIAGDIIGRKDDIHISGNATILRSDDDTRKISPCSICGRHTPMTEGYTCPRCGRFVCSSCYDDEHGICLDCRRREIEEAESGYLAYLRDSIRGPIGKIQKEALIKEAQKRDIDAGKASLMISSALKAIGAEELSEVLSKVDRDILDKASGIYFSGKKGSEEEAYALLRPLYERRSSNAEVLDIYLQVLRDADRDAYVELIGGTGAASPVILTLRIEDAAEAGQLLEAEDMLREAKLLYPESVMIKAEEVMLLLRLAHSLGISSYSEEAKKLAASLGDEGSILDRSYAMKARIASGAEVDFLEVKSELQSHKLYGRLCKVSSEIYVGTEMHDSASISEAIAFATPGVKIVVRPGTYKETVSFNKDIEIISLAAYEGREIKAEEMPVIVSEAPIDISSKLMMKGIIMTSDGSLKPEDIPDLLKEKAAGKLKAKEKEPELQAGNPFLRITGTAELHDCIIARVPETAIGLSGGASLSFIDSCIAGAPSCGIYAEKESKLKISGGRISGCGIAGLYSRAESEVKNLSVSACMRGFSLDGDNGAYTACRAFGNTLDGICVSSGNPSISGCISLKNGRSGYRFEHESHPVLSDCRAESNALNGFFTADNSEAELKKCVSESNKADGYRIDHGSKPVLISCTASRNTYNGFQCFFRSKPLFMKCIALNNKMSGFECFDNSAAEFNDCKASENEMDGFFFAGSSEIKVALCKAEKNGRGGFAAQLSPSVSLVECSAINSEGCGFLSYESTIDCDKCIAMHNKQYGFCQGGATGTVVLKGCKASCNIISGFYMEGNTSGRLEDCCSEANEDYGFFIADNAAPSLIECNASKNKLSGFAFGEASVGEVSQCFSSENGECGFILFDTANPVMKGCTASGNQIVGYYITNNATGRFEDCISESNEQFGYSISENASPILSKCNALKNKKSGFIFDGDSAGEISGCFSQENEQDGFLFLGSSSAVIRFSKARQNLMSGFYFMDSTATVCESCISEANENAGFEVHDTSEPAIKQCSAMRNKGNGYLYSEEAGGPLENCTSSDNDGCGYYIDSGANPVLANNEAHGNKKQDYLQAVLAKAQVKR